MTTLSTMPLVSKLEHEASYSADRCNICGCAESRTLWFFHSFEGRGTKYEDVRVIQCLACGVRRRDPALQDDYEEDYHAPYVDQGAAIHAHILQHFSDIMTLKFATFRAGKERLLDVGCSTGRVLQLGKVMGFLPTGLDLSRWAADHCRNLGFESHCGSLVNHWATGDLFDVIHCSHTIEHVTDPVSYLLEMRKLLVPGGLLMLAFPNYQSVQRFYWGKSWPIWCLDSHLWQFSLRQMVVLCKRVGLQPTIVRSLHGYRVKSKFLKAIFDIGSSLRLSDGAQIIAKKSGA